MNIQKPVLVTDMGGVLYSFSPKLDPGEHEELFENAIKSLGLKDADVKQELKGELEAINNGLLNIYANKSGVVNLKKNSEKYSVVVVSTSLVETSTLILKKLGLVDKVWKIFDMSEFGSKKNPESWETIFRQLPSVDIIVEDGDVNLEAARTAAERLGFPAKTYSLMPSI